MADSGCTASATTDARHIINARKCDEVFGDANGLVVKCTAIGDTPVIAVDSTGATVWFKLTNVSVVPSFKYTLLSVTQMWKEQRINARFSDKMDLLLPPSAGGLSIPFKKDSALCVVELISEPIFSSGSTAASRSSSSTSVSNSQYHSLLGFHDVKSISHIAKLSSAQAGELFHRRTHAGLARTRAAPDNTCDAPGNLRSAPMCTCVHCAQANIRKALHSGKLRTPAPGVGKLHFDLKGPMTRSIGGAFYAGFWPERACLCT